VSFPCRSWQEAIDRGFIVVVGSRSWRISRDVPENPHPIELVKGVLPPNLFLPSDALTCPAEWYGWHCLGLVNHMGRHASGDDDNILAVWEDSVYAIG
jgi:hypothetical protein